jgi:hypothetical protein
MAITKIQSESLNLADNYDFTGTVTGVGISEIDTWFYTANEAIPSAYANNLLSNNWSRLNQNNFFEKTGTGMTESSGTFTFPSTGKYLIIFQATIATRNNVDIRRTGATIEATTNNSTYSTFSRTLDSAPLIDSAETYSSASASGILDVTDTANVKVRFRYFVEATDGQIFGSSTYKETGVDFIKLADT